MQWIDVYQAYVFDTGAISGTITPVGHYPGVSGLMHREQMLNVVRPHKALLNPEYYLGPGSGAVMHPRWLAQSGRVEHEMQDARVVLRFPAEPLFGVVMDLAYMAHDDMIDTAMTLTPTRAVDAFEIFFASYVCEAFNETWVALGEPDDYKWTRLDNRGEINGCFAVARDNQARQRMHDGRWGDRDGGLVAGLEERPFAMPMLIDRDARTGMALCFLLDPNHTTVLGGQYHGWDTAHDWSFGADLALRRAITMRARMIYRRFVDESEMQVTAEMLWKQFHREAPVL